MIFHDWSLWPKAGGKITLTLTDAGTEVLCRCSGRRGGEIYLNGDMLSAGTDATYTANKNATIEFDTSGASYYLRITEI